MTVPPLCLSLTTKNLFLVAMKQQQRAINVVFYSPPIDIRTFCAELQSSQGFLSALTF